MVAGKWGFSTVLLDQQDINENNNSFDLQLNEGIEDIFLLDLGWSETGSAPQGQFELAVPPVGGDYFGRWLSNYHSAGRRFGK